MNACQSYGKIVTTINWLLMNYYKDIKIDNKNQEDDN